MKKIKHLGIFLASMALVLTSCGNDTYKEVRFNRTRRGEIIDAITKSDVIDALYDSKFDIALRHRYRYFNDDDTVSEGDVNGTYIGEAKIIVLNKDNNSTSKVDINGDITLGEKSLDDFSNTFYYLNDDRVYHSFSSLNSEEKNVFYSLPSFDENQYIDPIRSTIKDDLLDCTYVALENNKQYQITFNLKNKVYSYLYEYAQIYYAKENNITPSEISPEQRTLIKTTVDSTVDLSSCDITFFLRKDELTLLNYFLSLVVTITDTKRTNAANYTYNKYIIDARVQGNVKYDQNLSFDSPNTSLYSESEKGQEILDLLSSVL